MTDHEDYVEDKIENQSEECEDELLPDEKESGEYEDEDSVSYGEMFDNLDVTTITMVLHHSRVIDYWSAFYFLPVMRGEIITPNKATAKAVKLNFCNNYGALYTLRHPVLGDRGIAYTTKKAFKNCITVKLETEKIYTMKLYSKCLHVTGVHSIEDAIQCQNQMFYYLALIERVRSYVKTDEASSVLDWVFEHSKGRYFKEIDDYEVIIPEFIPATFLPDSIEEDTIYLLLSYEVDYDLHSEFCSKIDFFINGDWTIFVEEKDEQNNVIEKTGIEFSGLRTHMINYNYSLPFTINCTRLSMMINGYEGFVCRPIIRNPNVLHVDLEHNCYVDDKKRRKNRVPHHTITFNRSGSIAQSSPTFEEAKKCFILVMKAIMMYDARTNIN